MWMGMAHLTVNALEHLASRIEGPSSMKEAEYQEL